MKTKEGVSKEVEELFNKVVPLDFQNELRIKAVEEKAKKKEYDREYYQRPDVKAKEKEYRQRPDVKAKKKEYHREYYQRPDVKAKRKEYDRKRYLKIKKLKEEGKE